MTCTVPWRVYVRPNFCCCYVALSWPTVKCEKTGSVFFIYFFLCQIWAKNLLKFVFNGLKKHLHDLYMRFDCIPPEFSPFRNFKKNIGKLNSLTVRKKKKKKIPTDRPNFQILVGWGQHNNFFFWPYITPNSTGWGNPPPPPPPKKKEVNIRMLMKRIKSFSSCKDVLKCLSAKNSL